MARIGKAGPDYKDEFIVTFRREENQTYTKITKQMSRDWKTGGIKELKRLKAKEEGPYELVDATAHYDEKVQYQDLDGQNIAMYFKKIPFNEKEGDHVDSDRISSD